MAIRFIAPHFSNEWPFLIQVLELELSGLLSTFKRPLEVNQSPI